MLSKSHTTLLTIIIFTFLTVYSLPQAIAVPTPERTLTYNITIPDLPQGEWRMSFISLGEIEKFNKNFSKGNILGNYPELKNKCGKADSFRKEQYVMTLEERNYSANWNKDGTKAPYNGSIYRYRYVSDNLQCNYLEREQKLSYDSRKEPPVFFTFQAYYDSYMWDRGVSQYIKGHTRPWHVNVATCVIADNTCSIIVKDQSDLVYHISNLTYEPYHNPYLILLEQMNSSNYYLSNKIQLNTSLFLHKDYRADLCVYPTPCRVNKYVILNVTSLNLEENNSLTISMEEITLNQESVAEKALETKQLEPQSEIKATPKYSIWVRIRNWFKSSK
jgi:hypothetical protein